MEECKHEKVYANFTYASNPPITPWICKKCGQKGMETSAYISYEETYEQIARKFQK
jgi:hypothetical protein